MNFCFFLFIYDTFSIENLASIDSSNEYKANVYLKNLNKISNMCEFLEAFLNKVCLFEIKV